MYRPIKYCFAQCVPAYGCVIVDLVRTKNVIEAPVKLERPPRGKLIPLQLWHTSLVGLMLKVYWN